MHLVLQNLVKAKKDFCVILRILQTAELDCMNFRDLPAMQGSGLCQNDIVFINMEALKDGFRASYLGEFVKNKQSGLLSIKLPAIIAQNSQVINLLGQYGFEKMQDQWQANMEIGL